MKEYIKSNIQFIILMLIWVVAGHINTELASGIVIFSIILLKYRNNYAELMMAFCFLLLLSDNRHHQYDFAKQTKDIVLILISAFVLLDRKHFRYPGAFYYPFALFLLLGIVMSYRHPTPFFSFQKAISYTLVFTVIPGFFIKLFHEQAEDFLRRFIFFFTLVLFAGLSMILWNHSEAYLVGRFNGMLGNPNGVGTYCTVLSLLLGATLFHFPKLFSRQDLYIIVGVIALSVVMSGSRNAIFSILIFLFFRRFYRISYWYGFVIVIVAILLFQVANQYLPDIIVTLGLGNYFRVEHLDDGSGRLIAWKFAWDEIKQNIIFGRGFAFDEYYFFENKDFLSSEGHQGGVHNTYLSIWMNTGITGLILFLFGMFRTFFRASSTCYLALPALFAILFSITFESWLMGSLNPFTILAILTASLMQFNPAHHEQQEKDRIPVL